MSSDDVSQELQRLKTNNIVIHSRQFAEKTGCDNIVWSKWTMPAFGIFTIIIFQEKG